MNTAILVPMNRGLDATMLDNYNWGLQFQSWNPISSRYILPPQQIASNPLWRDRTRRVVLVALNSDAVPPDNRARWQMAALAPTVAISRGRFVVDNISSTFGPTTREEVRNAIGEREDHKYAHLLRAYREAGAFANVGGNTGTVAILLGHGAGVRPSSGYLTNFMVAPSRPDYSSVLTFNRNDFIYGSDRYSGRSSDEQNVNVYVDRLTPDGLNNWATAVGFSVVNSANATQLTSRLRGFHRSAMAAAERLGRYRAIVNIGAAIRCTNLWLLTCNVGNDNLFPDQLRAFWNLRYVVTFREQIATHIFPNSPRVRLYPVSEHGTQASRVVTGGVIPIEEHELISDTHSRAVPSAVIECGSASGIAADSGIGSP